MIGIPENRIFIGNIDHHVDKNDFMNTFKQYGDIVKIDFK